LGAKPGAVSCQLVGGFNECIEKYFETIADIAGGGKSLVAIGHSMGAAMTLLAMRSHPGLFDAAVMPAPMLALKRAVASKIGHCCRESPLPL
jgi:alpha-beta hydrolase superfamily lysophospholipase